MGVRTRGLDIAIGAKRHVADAAARVEAKAVIGEPDNFPTEIVAAKITHFAQAGVHDADELSRAVLKDFKLLY
jgi:hypothetical protein